jgi:hypothetical protein
MRRYVSGIIAEIQEHSTLHTKRHRSGNKYLFCVSYRIALEA